MQRADITAWGGQDSPQMWPPSCIVMHSDFLNGRSYEVFYFPQWSAIRGLLFTSLLESPLVGRGRNMRRKSAQGTSSRISSQAWSSSSPWGLLLSFSTCWGYRSRHFLLYRSSFKVSSPSIRMSPNPPSKRQTSSKPAAFQVHNTPSFSTLNTAGQCLYLFSHSLSCLLLCSRLLLNPSFFRIQNKFITYDRLLNFANLSHPKPSPPS
jgi:hypothetical protein